VPQIFITISIIVIVLALLGVGFYFLRKKLIKKLSDQQALIQQHKVTTSILVIDKKKQRVTKANLPKSVMDQIPKMYRFRKMPLVKAKVGPQIMTLLCDDKVFDKLPTKKLVKVDLAGIFIVGLKQGKK
jgi:uncharacterized membrane protein YqiK